MDEKSMLTDVQLINQGAEKHLGRRHGVRMKNGIVYKIIMCGGSNRGQTSFITKYTTGQFERTTPTIGINMRDAGGGKTSLYFTSLVHRLREDGNYIPPSVAKSSFTHTKRHCLERRQDSHKKKAQKSAGDAVLKDVDKKQVPRALVQTKNEQTWEKTAASIAREKRKAINQLQNSKLFHTRTLRRLQDRQLEICRSREREQLLVQAHSLYDRAPVLETKRFCGACARRPRSAIANTQLTMSRSSQGVTPPSPTAVHARRKVMSAGARVIYSSSPACSSRGEQLSSLSERHLPSPVPSSICSTHSFSPMRSFDMSAIPNSSRTEDKLKQPSRSV